MPNEHCDIFVVGGGGTLAACPVFDTNDVRSDFLTGPDAGVHGGEDCPVGKAAKVTRAEPRPQRARTRRRAVATPGLRRGLC